jgi:hypothetical protein
MADVQTHWRLAFMFDAPGHDLAWLEAAMKAAAAAIRDATGGHPIRLGVADRDPSLIADDAVAEAMAGWRSVEGAVEVTLPNAKAGDLPLLAQQLKPILITFADLATVEITAGPTFHMVPVSRGSAFLSLAFRRYPGTTSEQFQTWWLRQHSTIAIPVLGPELLAYDQVHVDPDASRAVAAAFGVPHVSYDAYDNLTWADRSGFLTSCSRDPAGMMRVAADEEGRIDNDSRRHGLMREVIG